MTKQLGRRQRVRSRTTRSQRRRDQTSLSDFTSSTHGSAGGATGGGDHDSNSGGGTPIAADDKWRIRVTADAYTIWPVLPTLFRALDEIGQHVSHVVVRPHVRETAPACLPENPTLGSEADSMYPAVDATTPSALALERVATTAPRMSLRVASELSKKHHLETADIEDISVIETLWDRFNLDGSPAAADAIERRDREAAVTVKLDPPWGPQIGPLKPPIDRSDIIAPIMDRSAQDDNGTAASSVTHLGWAATTIDRLLEGQ